MPLLIEMVKLILVRHAESKMNKLDIHQGQLNDSELSPEGVEQSKALAKLLKSKNINEIYSSDMKRAIETANIISQTIGNIEVKKDKRLREFTMGDFDKTPELRDELFKKLHAEEIAKGKSKYEIRPPNGENIWDFINRLGNFLNDMKNKNGTILAVAHGGTNEVIFNIAQNLEKDQFKRYHQDNTCINELVYENGKWNILLINKTPHLIKKEKPSKEIYINQEKIKKEILDKVKTILSEQKIHKAYLFGSLIDKKFGRYSQKYGRHKGSNINVLTYLAKENIPRKWKYIDNEEGLWEIYEAGKVEINGIKHRIDTFLLKDEKEIERKIIELNLKVEKIGEF